ncbi:hypothetical protein ABFX02_09G051900 [Erythranthe guttata]
MAFAALVSLQQTIDLCFLNCDVLYSFSPDEKQQIISMKKHITSLRVFLEEFREEINSNLEGQIRDVAYHAEDVIESFAIHNAEDVIESLSIPYARVVMFRSQLSTVAMEVDSIAGKVFNRMKEVHLGGGDDSHATTSSSRLPPSSGKEFMVGCNDDLMDIRYRLCGPSSQLQVIPIVGMAGIGKTTLATNAYHHPLIIEHFDIRAWVTLTQDSSTEKVSSSLVDDMKNLVRRLDESNEVKVFKVLKGRKYLIVLDDIWSRKAWDDIKRMFPDDNNGSRIILTTRMEEVAAYPDPRCPIHKMELLDEDHSLTLFWKIVEDCPSELEIYGELIARCCGGLPLAIVVIAGLLAMVSKTKASWVKFALNVKSAIGKEDGKFEEIISLSYTHLPHHLRPCFLYMGAFPEDHEIDVSELVKLWVAEGFIKSSSVFKSLEEAAEEEYLDELVKRSLVMVTKRNSDDKIKTCKLHDLIRELCLRISQQEKFLMHLSYGEDPQNIIENQRRIVINQSYYYQNTLPNINSSTIRSVICFMAWTKGPYKDLGCFKFLKIIRFTGSYDLGTYREITRLPNQVFKLFHLRYISFSYLIEIPPAISNLRNLQTLIIHPKKAGMMVKPCVQYLPLEIWGMTELRHLVCYNFGELPNSEEVAGSSCALEKLQTLWEVTDLICTRAVLETIPNIKELAIRYSEEHRDKEYQLDNLVHLKQLEKLKITVAYFRSPMRWRDITPEACHETLKRLSVSGGNRPWSQMKILGSLPNLQVLKIKSDGFFGEIWETSEGE